MTHKPLSPRPLALTVALLTPVFAGATNGYFAHGYGAKSLGMAGVGLALPQDALAAATNPAGTVDVGDRFDMGLTGFVPRRSAEITGNAYGPDASYDGNESRSFLIPEVGYTHQVNASAAVGVAVYGNGGMNTNYGSNPYGRFGAQGSAGVNLEQLFLSPSVAYRIDERNAVGAALTLAYQRFSAKGLGPFASFSVAPDNVSDQGTDTSSGAGVRLGWTGKVTPRLTLGAAWASKIRGRFDKYKGLFADGGSFDIPENYGLGLALAATPDLTLAADVQQIRYSQVAAVGNSAASLFSGQPLGSANGPGFGWRDVTVLKLGVSHRVSSTLTLRGGVSFNNQPVPGGETFFNVLAPGVVQRHLTLGATWTTPAGDEVTGYFAHGVGKTVQGVNSIPGSFGGGNANIRLQENMLGFAFSWKL